MMNDNTVRATTDDVPGRNQNRNTCVTYMAVKVHRRVIASEIEAQKIRPTALPILAMPTMPAATMALALESSWKIGDSCEIREIPAEVFRNKSTHSAHHCHVPSAPPSV